MNELTHIDLFSGIGGFALAARWAGIKTVQFVEIDKFCQKVLQKNFPGVPIHDDIKTFTYAKSDRWDSSAQPEMGEEESRRKRGCGFVNSDNDRPFLLTGGFPCQPYSCAGKRKGKKDDRALWPEMLRVISEAKPYWVIGENVAGFIGMGLDDCISDLEREGYEVQVFVIPACALNAPHRRDRVWIVAHSNTASNGRDCSGSLERGRQNQDMQIGADTENKQGREGRFAIYSQTDYYAPDTDSQYSKEHKRGNKLRQEGSESTFGRGVYEPMWEENWLTAASRFCRVDDGLPRQVDRVNRLKALGNAIVPQVAYQIMRAIVEIETSHTGHIERCDE